MRKIIQKSRSVPAIFSGVSFYCRMIIDLKPSLIGQNGLEVGRVMSINVFFKVE